MFLGLNGMRKFHQSILRDWIDCNVREFKRDEWELSDGDDSCDFFLYDLSTGENYYIDTKGNKLIVFYGDKIAYIR